MLWLLTDRGLNPPYNTVPKSSDQLYSMCNIAMFLFCQGSDCPHSRGFVQNVSPMSVFPVVDPAYFPAPGLFLFLLYFLLRDGCSVPRRTAACGREAMGQRRDGSPRLPGIPPLV
jgi:hypothetical protein